MPRAANAVLSGVLDTFVLAEPLNPSGYTWTLASRLGEILREAEKRFGSRDTSYTLLGVEFCVDGPQTWFPWSEKAIIIQLNRADLLDEMRALYQLAHEVVHLLDPTGETERASVLEEGLATHFSIEYMGQRHGISFTSSSPKYTAACDIASRLMAAAPDSVKMLRARGKRISEVSTDDLKGVCPELSDSDVAIMTQRFRNWTP